MHVDEVLCHGESGGATWETSRRGCIMRKAVSKEVTAGRRFNFFLGSGPNLLLIPAPDYYFSGNFATPYLVPPQLFCIPE